MTNTLLTSLVLLFIIAPFIGLLLVKSQTFPFGKLPDDIERQARVLAGFSAAFLCLALSASTNSNVLVCIDILVAMFGTVGAWILVVNDCWSFKWWQKCVKFTLTLEVIYLALGLGMANVGVKLTNYNQFKNVPFATLLITIIGYSFCWYGIFRNIFHKVKSS